MSDLIDRQAAIEALGDEPEVWTGKDEYAQGLNNQWHYDRNAILALPSAQPEPKWIPCSERLPEDEQLVLFSTKTGRVHQGKYYNDGSVNQWYSAFDKMRAWNNVVNAWMPLPEPYEERREE